MGEPAFERKTVDRVPSTNYSEEPIKTKPELAMKQSNPSPSLNFSRRHRQQPQSIVKNEGDADRH